MKAILLLLLAGSLALNGTLALLLVRGAAINQASPAVEVKTTAASSAVTTKTAPDQPSAPAAWAAPKPADLPALVEELRAAGFPAETIRLIITGLVMEQFAERRKALDPDAATRPYWKNQQPDPKMQAAMIQLGRELQKTLRDLLGPDATSSDPLQLARRRAQFGNLSTEKLSQAEDIVRTYEDKRQDMFREGMLLQADQGKLRDLEKQQRSALAQILSPTELEEYDLRTSNTGRTLRTELAAFHPTEEEFRTIFRLRQPFDEQWNRFYDSGLPSQEDMNRRSAADKVVKEQIRAALGPERGAEYELSTDYNYRTTSQLVARLELPRETTNQLWNLQKEYQQKILDLRRNLNGAPSSNATEQATALQSEAAAKATALLGSPRALEAYKQYGGGWIQSMAPRTLPGRPPTR